jgi:UDP-N-acetylmuramoylalanine--D-glutamate ligase
MNHMTVNTYFEQLQGKRVTVIGLGISNRPLVRLLLERGIAVECRDKTPREKLLPEVLELERLGAKLTLGEDYLENIQADVVFRTPGLNAFCPQLMALRAQGTLVTSEMEAFFAVCPCKIVGVTGSDGKTTTTTLIAKLLEKAGKTVWCGGNIGTPLLPLADQMQPTDVAVVELSSFQLMGMTQSPQTAVITNLSPNHLDIHKDMEEYVTAKENLYLHQSAQDTVVLNLDNDITNSFVPKAKGNVLQFSRKQRPQKGYYLRPDNIICRVDGDQETEILDAADILIPGVHNFENYMAAFCAVDGLVSRQDMVDLAKTFGGVAHRIQLVREKDGVKFYDSSIDSSPNRTKAALRSFSQKVIMVAGGKDKGIAYDDLGPELVEHVKILVLTGMTAGKIRAAAEQAPGYNGANPIILDVEDFDEAIRTAAAQAKPGDVVILSPASTSFDRFRNFEERGLRFQKVVNKL